MTELIREAQTLTKAVQVLAESTARLAISQRRWRRIAIVTLTGLVLDIGLTIGGAFILDQQHENGQRIAGLEQRTRVDVLCPLYDVFLASYDPKRRDALPAAQRGAYDHAFRVIREGRRILGC